MKNGEIKPVIAAIKKITGWELRYLAPVSAKNAPKIAPKIKVASNNHGVNTTPSILKNPKYATNAAMPPTRA